MNHENRQMVAVGVLSGVLTISSPLFAQTDRATQRLDAAFDATMAAHLGDWKPDPTVLSHALSHQKRWQRGASEVRVYYSLRATGRDAAKALLGTISLIQIPGIQPLSGFGDQAYWMPHSDPGGGSVLYCRRGTIVLEVYAPAPDDFVKQVTTLLLAEVEKELARPADPR